MKQVKYTLIELLAAMSIFIIMMGLLFNVFVNASAVVGSQNAKVTILSDANVFFTYISNDLANISLSSIPQLLDNENGEVDPDAAGADSVATTSDKLTIDATTIAFRSDVEYYHAASFSTPYVIYEFDSSTGTVTRRMREVTGTAVSADADAIILDGVQSWEINVWDDYPGGTPLTATTYDQKPACITIAITLSTPNPSASAETIEQNLRTVTKTIYIDR